MPVFRFCSSRQPTANNPKYATWQPANFIAFIAAENGLAAEKKFQAKLKKLHWKILDWNLRDKLIEERVREIGGEVLQAYEVALTRGERYRVDSEHFMADTMAKNTMSPPRPDESFIDGMVLRAGGRRLTAEERDNDQAENADYLIEEFIVEGKDLQERAARERARPGEDRRNWPYFEEAAVVSLDPSVLSDNDWQRFVEILARPIEAAVNKASRQVKATIARMRIVGWESGIILLNSGYTSLPHKLFEQLAAKAIRDRPIKLLVCLTARTQTNGFDSYMTWEFSPKNPSSNVEKKLFDAFNHVVSEIMNEWGRGGFMPNPNSQPLVEPVSFDTAARRLFGTLVKHLSRLVRSLTLWVRN